MGAFTGNVGTQINQSIFSGINHINHGQSMQPKRYDTSKGQRALFFGFHANLMIDFLRLAFLYLIYSPNGDESHDLNSKESPTWMSQKS